MTRAAPSAALIARSLGWMAAGQLVVQALWFGSLVVLAMLLPPEAFGVVAVGMAVLFFANVLVGMGTRASIIAAPELGPSEVRAATLLTCGPGAAVAVLVAAFADPIAAAFASGGQAGALRGMSLAVAFIAFSIVPLAVLDKRLRFKRSAAAKAGAALVASTTAIVAAAAGAGVWALVARQVLYYGLVAALAWLLARDVLPRGAREGDGRRALRRAGSRAFLVLACADFVALTADTLVVGLWTDATQLGLYSLAFTLAFLPLTQLSWPIGQVLFPAAAATGDLAVLGRRTLVAVRTTGLVLLPAVPVAIASAPVLIPELLGERWRDMVGPFQLLLVAGVGHAILNCIGESLSGAGAIGFQARVHAVWAPSTVTAALVMVALDGIRGAAIAHVALLVPLAVAYVARGVPLLGLRSRDVWACLRGVAIPVGAQALVTAATLAVLDESGLVAAAVGAAVAVVLLGRGSPSPFRQTRLLLAAARSAPTHR